jgi:hypothetical protein
MDSTAAATIRPRSAKSKGVLLLGLVFLLGMICGGALFFLGARSVLPPPHGGRPPFGDRRGGMHPLQGLKQELQLDAEQEERVSAILLETRQEIRAALEDSRADIRAVLRPDQQDRFDTMRPHHRRGRGPRGHFPPDPPPPPPPDEAH